MGLTSCVQLLYGYPHYSSYHNHYRPATDESVAGQTTIRVRGHYTPWVMLLLIQFSKNCCAALLLNYGCILPEY